MLKRINWLKTFILLGKIGVPLTATVLFCLSDRGLTSIFIFSFWLFHAFERVWETFYTSHERKPFQFHGDWTLAVVTLAYLVLSFVILFEFYLLGKNFSVWISGLGLMLYAIAFRLRWWGMKSLGQQWAIHAVGAQKIKKVRVIRLGAFKYIRHPIYLGIMVEVVSLALIANATYALLFACLINIPLQVIRLREEEKSSVRRFGESYQTYQQEVDMLMPFKHFRSLFQLKRDEPRLVAGPRN